MASPEQNKRFVTAILPQWPLDDAIEWIAGNMDPEDVFPEKELAHWATENGFKAEE